ncbi:MAG: T9SS type B sorting domain-containing protein [Bacteroidetes bacterium]|nr:T9SS type B sorting domain-containing protein [Bacteroidota bacterium]
MKKVLLFLILLMSWELSAQRDTDHWFAPMVERTSIGTNNQNLYLSTDEVNPFDVLIYGNGNFTNPIITVTGLKKGTPKIVPIPKDNIVTTGSPSPQVFNPNSTMGIFVKGTKPFFARLGITSSTTHAEMVTSKGRAGLGNKFYSVNTQMYYNSSIANFMTSIMATEDGTQVTVSGYDPIVEFSNGTNGATNPTLTFTLNKGRSYIIEGWNSGNNFDSFIGAKIESNKPISVTNGNYNGNYVTGGFDGSDIIMDQSVPVERLGDTFALIKGNGAIGDQMEGAIIVATEPNTEIYVNNETTPLATINEGDYFRVPETKYINQANTGHYNMYIHTTKNVYVYQLLGGIAGNNATEGFNYIPPLNCFLPRKIDELGNINLNPGAIPTKLNIVTEANATITATSNGAPITLSGPHILTGNAAWVTYSAANVTGTIVVNSTSAVTAGISAGSGTSGYGGYFAGVSSVPIITKQAGDCIPGIILEVNPDYDFYQWYWNGNLIPGATTHTYTPTQPGNYTCVVNIGNCTPKTTPVFKVFNCKFTGTTNINVCGSAVITPSFAGTGSTQTPVNNTVSIVTPPAHGTAVINNNGTITYTPNAGYLGPDTFLYTFCGNAPEFIDCMDMTVNINVVQLSTLTPTIYACNNNDATTAVFDLTSQPVTTYTGNHTKKFYKSLADMNAGTNEITNPTNYTSTAPATIYVKITTPEGCSATTTVELKFYELPIVTPVTISSCFLDNDNTKASFNLTTANISPSAPIVKKFYPTMQDAINNTNSINNPAAYVSGDGEVYARVINDNQCYRIVKITLFVIKPKPSPILVDQYICIEDTTTLDAGPGYTAYLWSNGATTQSITNIPVGDYFVVLSHEGCNTKQFVRVLEAPKPIISQIDITNNTVTLTVTNGKAPYQYSLDGISWQASNVFTGLPRGENKFYVKDAYDCEPVMVQVTVPNFINAITPNNDGVNDYIDYSELAYKDNFSFVIYDRYGKKIATLDKDSNYRWDGKFQGKRLNTGTYWYHVTWNERDANKSLVNYSGWILLKNF